MVRTNMAFACVTLICRFIRAAYHTANFSSLRSLYPILSRYVGHLATHPK
jgi:hypothetical protein